MISTYEKANRGKLLAVLMAFAMIITGVAIVMSDNEVSAVGEVAVPEDAMPLSESILAVYEELAIEGDAYIPSGDNVTLTIPADKTLRIMSGGALYLNGGTLNIVGTLIIESGASVYGNGTIALTRSGTFDNTGILGATYVPETGESVSTEITITAVQNVFTTYDGKGSVSISNVSGATFGFVNTTADGATKAEYTLTVSGDLIAEDYENNNVTVNGARIVGDFYIGQDVNASIVSSEIRNGVTITVDGSMSVTNLVMYNGSQITVNGNMTGTVNAVTGDYMTRNGETSLSDQTQFAITNVAENYTVSGYTLSVGTSAYQKENADGTNEAWTAQRMYVSGTVAFVAGADADPNGAKATMVFDVQSDTLPVYGPVVAEGATLSIPAGMDISNANAAFQVLGTITDVNAISTGVKFAYVGGSYVVSGENGKFTGYVMTFAEAMADIASAYRQTVYVSGDLEIDSTYTIAAGQTLNLEKAGEIVVKEGGDVTVEQRGAVNGGKAVVVEGVATIQSPSSVGTITFQSATKSTGTNDAGIRYTQYAGLQYAIDNATAGAKISVTGTAIIDGNLVIPQGVTVTVEDDGAITITGNLIVETEATLNVIDKRSVTLTGARSTTTVNGTMDVTEGSILFDYNGTSKVNTALTTPGTFICVGSSLVDSKFPVTINAVYYTNADSEIVMTNAEAAIAGASAMDITDGVTVLGNVTAGDLELTVDMLVLGEPTFGNITLADGVAITIYGEMSATVSAATGTEGSTTTSSIVLDDVGFLTISAGSVVDAQNVKTYQLQIDEIDELFFGNVTVSTGTVTIANDINNEPAIIVENYFVDNDKTYYSTLKVASGATLLVPEGAYLWAGTARNDAPAVTIEGTLVAEGTVEIDKMLVSGAFEVDSNDVSVIGEMTVTGTLDMSVVENEEATLNVEGTLNVGEKITAMGGSTTGAVTGAITTEKTGVVKVYNGASVESAVIDDDGNGATGADSTVLYINGNVYMTIYGNYSLLGEDTVFANEEFDIVGYDMTGYGYDIASADCWYADAGLTEKVKDNSEAVYTIVSASDVEVRISVGTAISLYVDNIKYTSGQTAVLSVGTHTISTQVNPGYSGTVTVQFNGQTVTGSFTITPEMASAAYSGTITLTATGDISYDSGSVIVENTDDGMGITDYLLIILVVLVIVLAVIVAMRMMRS